MSNLMFDFKLIHLTCQERAFRETCCTHVAVIVTAIASAIAVCCAFCRVVIRPRSKHAHPRAGRAVLGVSKLPC
jgi:hypothetical protein